jgi:glycosyltransferase involved in cell wall biosynthesis
MKKHILVISQYFHPENFRINDLCQDWIKRNYRVSVITGIPNYPQGAFFHGYGLFCRRKELYHEIEINRLPIIPRGKSSIMLVLNYISFVISGLFWSLFTRINADIVFIFEVSPMTQALPGVWYARRRRIPCCLYVQDLWPESIEIVAGLKNKLIIRAIRQMTHYIYKHCTWIFTTSESFKSAIAKQGVPRDKIRYWPQYAEDYCKPVPRSRLAEIPDDGRFNIIFAGNIGFAQGLEILPRTAELLKQARINVRFNLVGDGRFRTSLIQITKDRKVDELFNFIDRQPAARIPEFLAANDAAFLSLTNSPLFAMTIPAKLQTYLACGIPIIASADGETQVIIEKAQAGVCSPAGDAEKLADNIAAMAARTPDQLRRMAMNAREYYLLNFNKNKLMSEMDIYLGENSLGEEKQHVFE